MFSHRIRELRKKRNMTQRQLANILFVDCSSVTKWETGKSNPDFKKQQELAKLFNVSIDYLLGRTDDPLTLSSSSAIMHIQNFPTENTIQITRRTGTRENYILSDEQVDLVEGLVKQMSPATSEHPLSYGAVAAEGDSEQSRRPTKKPKTTL